ncbi:MAG: hypothetical protein J0M35_10120 [Candidatus Obscuribacter phosphatis]|uniref:Ribosomal protein L7/L12 C-terminal domain-containing protein n=1 Tax=Candidatus Obscuribacter phosphatis TaxID=1906157 RepID=A0A8J7P804_9BACT|nr:hypothetical protein [Candidatus Obscuribacter phosphatis]
MNSELTISIGLASLGMLFILGYLTIAARRESENLLLKPMKPGKRLTISKEAAEEIATLLRNNKRLEALKELRAASGADLKRAKEVIDRVAAGQSFRSMVSLKGEEQADSDIDSDSETELKQIEEELDGRLRDLLAKGRKIDAIKLYREQTGASLKEAKEAIEARDWQH